jgi:hypothetical protein
MCFAHVIRKVDAKLNVFTTKKQKEVRALIRNDILQLQLCESDSIFGSAIKFFFAKWSQHNSTLINNFLNYFEIEWCGSLIGWYEGYAVELPSHNNVLESNNKVIKDESTFRKRINIGQFLNLAEKDIVGRWSTQRAPNLDNPNVIEFADEVNVVNRHNSGGQNSGDNLATTK